MPLNSAASGSVVGNALSSMAGFTQKAVLEIADLSNVKPKKNESQKPTSGASASLGGIGGLDTGSFNIDAVKNFAGTIGISGLGEEGFELYGSVNKYKFEVQFNPDEIYINGYGGEALPIQNYDKRDEHDKEHEKNEQGDNGTDSQKKANKIVKGTQMASATTRIDMSFKIAFDKSNPQDAFYADKFTLSQTSIGKGIARGVAKKKGLMSNSVQPEVEALTALVRSGNKRLTRFVWGDMAYEGVLNSVNAEYVMFNCNGEPCRAFVSLNMVLYDKEVAGANTDIWQTEYMKDIFEVADKTTLASPFGGVRI